ncbi:hypothetical protein [Streptomyces sp. NPDC014006]|uniref:hypothetical protein n=1 Tax=Streptomyces sp. NPDC014006 TaxID=3364870 RepID=UPI0036F931CE
MVGPSFATPVPLVGRTAREPSREVDPSPASGDSEDSAEIDDTDGSDGSGAASATSSSGSSDDDAHGSASPQASSRPSHHSHSPARPHSSAPPERPAHSSAVPFSARPGPSASTDPSASAGETRRAGSRAGEGRERPGRAHDPLRESARDEGATENEDAGQGIDNGDDMYVPQEQEAGLMPSASASVPTRQSVRAESPVDPVLRILPLGSGLVLIGLGLALGLLALRLRREPRLYRTGSR